VRFVIAGAALYLWMRVRGAAKPSSVQWRNAAVVGGFLILGGNGGVVWAEQFVPSGMAALLVAILPFWMVLVDWLRPGGTRPGVGVTVGLIVGMIGLLILIGPSALNPSAESEAAARAGDGVMLTGAIVLVLASLSWALGSIYSRHADLPKSAFVATGMEMFAGGALMLLLAFSVGDHSGFDIGQVSVKSMLAFAYLIIVGSLLGFTAYIWLLKVQPASRVATYAYVNPIVAVFLGWAFAGETLSARTAIAAAIIIGAVALITTARSSSPPQVAE
jgi:drug/metabolite transporter (DMT)-like permease